MTADVMGEQLDDEILADELAFNLLRELVEDYPELVAIFERCRR